MSQSKIAKPPSRKKLGKEDWIAAAIQTLIHKGVNAIKVEILAKDLAATTGSFYWHFKKREELLDALLKEWDQNSVEVFSAAMDAAGTDCKKRFLAFLRVWLDTKAYSPAFDAAMRDWARTSTQVRKRVQKADEMRIELLRQALLSLGVSPEEAFIRARITYFHQIGYYTIAFRESLKQRLELLPAYVNALVGSDCISTQDIITVFGSLYKKTNTPYP